MEAYAAEEVSDEDDELLLGGWFVRVERFQGDSVPGRVFDGEVASFGKDRWRAYRRLDTSFFRFVETDKYLWRLVFLVVQSGGILAMQVSREPVSWSESVKHLLGCNIAEFPGLGILHKVFFDFEEMVIVSSPFNATRPIMANANVDLRTDLQ